MLTDLISVIIPVFNVEKYLRQCVDSVVNQTYPNIEIILVDDGYRNLLFQRFWADRFSCV